MAPVIAGVAGAGGKSRRQRPPVRRMREGLKPGEPGLRLEDARHRLDQSHRGIAGQGIGQLHDGGPRHQAVGVQHQHGRPVGTAGFQPVTDVAHLAVDGRRPAAIVDRDARRCHAAQKVEGAFFLGDAAGAAGVGQDEQRETVIGAGKAQGLAGQVLQHGGGIAEDQCGVFLVDRQQHGDLQAVRGRRQARAATPVRVARDKAQDRQHGALRDGQEGDRDQQAQDRDGHGRQVRRCDPDGAGHQHQGQRQGREDGGTATPGNAGAAGTRWGGGRVPERSVERLARAGQPPVVRSRRARVARGWRAGLRQAGSIGRGGTVPLRKPLPVMHFRCCPARSVTKTHRPPPHGPQMHGCVWWKGSADLP